MRILVVEDEHKIANSLKKGLEQEGFAVDVAYDGEEGYDLAYSEDYDLIVLDLMLPKMDGSKICSNLRKEEIHTPIIILTAKGSTEKKVEGLNSGADDYLAKPFSFVELLARIRALLRRPKNLIPSELSCGDLILDSQKMQVFRADKEISLSKKEFALLEYLLINKEMTVSKEKLMEHVWDYDADILPNTVEVYIGYLRNKIEKPFKSKQKIIKTVRGFGYKLSCK